VVVALALGALALILYPTFLEVRQGGELSPLDSLSAESSLASRSNLLGAGLAMFAANPVFGIGFGVFQFVSPEYLGGGLADSTFSHNQYVNVLAEQGLVGGAVAAAAIALLTLVLVRSRSPYRSGALAMGVTFLVASLYLHTATVFQTCSFLWLALAATLVSRPDRSVPVEDHRP
jgi:O-antigen ligase